METPWQRFERLLAALENLVAEEAAQVAGGDYAGVLRTQQRAAPVVKGLAGLGVASATARARVAALCARRQQTQQHLAARLEQRRLALADTAASQQRLALIAPAYQDRARIGAVGQLCARG